MGVIGNGLAAYRDALAGCRFCPMCKPAGEVSGLTLMESHTTRARALLLWRIAHGLATWEPRTAELLYQSTLDSISQAWCVSHYPVSDYVAAARAEVFEAGMVPEEVRQALLRPAPDSAAAQADALLLAGEAAELGDAGALQGAVEVVERSGVRAHPLLAASGVLAYNLGDRRQARAEAERVLGVIRDSGARLVIADGPQTLWALRRLYPALGLSLPAGVHTVSLAEHLAQSVLDGYLKVARPPAVAAFVHDSRSAALLADAMPVAQAIQPGYRGPEDSMGRGAVFEAPRQLAESLGLKRVYSVWSRSLCRSCGADDGLWLTYPHLAGRLAGQQAREAKRLGADVLLTDSLLCARHLAKNAGDTEIEIRWLPEMLRVPTTSAGGPDTVPTS